MQRSDATHRLGRSTADDADLFAVELDRQGGLGDQNPDGLVAVDAAEGDFLSGDHDYAGVGGAPLYPDRLC
jgi:hypothetical protein